MLASLLHTESSWAPTVLRIALAVVLFPHGAQKLLGWFGGYGFKGTMGYFTGHAGLPWLVGFAAIMIGSSPRSSCSRASRRAFRRWRSSACSSGSSSSPTGRWGSG